VSERTSQASECAGYNTGHATIQSTQRQRQYKKRQILMFLLGRLPGNEDFPSPNIHPPAGALPSCGNLHAAEKEHPWPVRAPGFVKLSLEAE